MAEYELVHEIQNSCPNNQMRDIFFEEVCCDDPESYLRRRLAGRALELTVAREDNGSITIHALVDGLREKFVFTPI